MPRYVTADEGKLRQVLMNLLGNAVKFTEQGRVVLRVHTASPPLGSGQTPSVWVRFQVEDTGPGIPADEDLADLRSPPSCSRALASKRRREPAWGWRSASSSCA